MLKARASASFCLVYESKNQSQFWNEYRPMMRVYSYFTPDKMAAKKTDESWFCFIKKKHGATESGDMFIHICRCWSSRIRGEIGIGLSLTRWCQKCNGVLFKTDMFTMPALHATQLPHQKSDRCHRLADMEPINIAKFPNIRGILEHQVLWHIIVSIKMHSVQNKKQVHINFLKDFFLKKTSLKNCQCEISQQK